MSTTLEHAFVDHSGVLTDCATERVSIHDIIRRHHESLIKFLRRRLPVADDADDVAQEAYIRMLKYEGSDEIKSPSAMLFRIAANVANDHGRAAQARCAADHVEIEAHDIVSDQPSAERTVLASQNLDILLAAIESLPPKCKQVFLLSRASGMTYPEIARHCGISVKMVEKQISRALAVCLLEVGAEDGITS
jgi:RNA polymerase sigma-70 factor (ECF subfamily)